jgi:hypothetical protein
MINRRQFTLAACFAAALAASQAGAAPSQGSLELKAINEIQQVDLARSRIIINGVLYLLSPGVVIHGLKNEPLKPRQLEAGAHVIFETEPAPRGTQAQAMITEIWVVSK